MAITAMFAAEKYSSEDKLTILISTRAILQNANAILSQRRKPEEL